MSVLALSEHVTPSLGGLAGRLVVRVEFVAWADNCTTSVYIDPFKLPGLRLRRRNDSSSRSLRASGATPLGEVHCYGILTVTLKDIFYHNGKFTQPGIIVPYPCDPLEKVSGSIYDQMVAYTGFTGKNIEVSNLMRKIDRLRSLEGFTQTTKQKKNSFRVTKSTTVLITRGQIDQFSSNNTRTAEERNLPIVSLEQYVTFFELQRQRAIETLSKEIEQHVLDELKSGSTAIDVSINLEDGRRFVVQSVLLHDDGSKYLLCNGSTYDHESQCTFGIGEHTISLDDIDLSTVDLSSCSARVIELDKKRKQIFEIGLEDADTEIESDDDQEHKQKKKTRKRPRPQQERIINP